MSAFVVELTPNLVHPVENVFWRAPNPVSVESYSHIALLPVLGG